MSTTTNPHSFLDRKHLGIAVTHKPISGETSLCTLCVALPSGLLGGPIVLEGFVGNLLRSEHGSTQEEVIGRNIQPTIRCKELNVTLNNEKCAMMLTNGIINHISAKGIELDLAKIKVILDFLTPCSQKHV
jgi:hypothetical protein